MLAVVAALVCVAPAKAALVALYTFDDVDTAITGDGLGDGNPDNNLDPEDPLFGIDDPEGTPFNLDLTDASENGNTASNIATELSQPPPWGWPVGAQFGNATITGEPGVFGQAHRFFRDPSIYQTDGGSGTSKEQANTTYYVDAATGTDAGSNGDIPDGADPRSFSFWFNQEADLTSYQGSPQNKLFGYGDQFAGEAFDIGLRDGGIQLRHFGGQIVWGSGFEFYQYQVDFGGSVVPGAGEDAGWHHLVVRVNDSASDFTDVDVFLDNMQLTVASSTTGALTTPINTGENIDGFGIGTTSIEAFDSAQNGFQGWLDQFRIYDHALNAQEIEDLFNESVGLAGDYNDDGVVDAADYTVWRDAAEAGAMTLLNRDPEKSGPVDESDYQYWRDRFGNVLGSGAGAGAAAVPEPTTLWMGSLAGIAVVGMMGRRGRGGFRRARETMR